MLPPAQTIDLDSLRVGFAHRMTEVIEEAGNLEAFWRITRRSTGRLSEWRSEGHKNWPEMKAFIEMVARADINPAWLIFGRGPKRLSDV